MEEMKTLTIGDTTYEIVDAKAREEISKLSGGNAKCLLTVETITIGEGSETVAVTGITLDYSSISLNEGDTMMLAASISPSDATNSTVLWESSDTSVATVNNGLVTAVSSGNATITAKSQENSSIKAICSVAVASASGEVKVQLSSFDMVDGLLKKDGETVYAGAASSYHVEIPYIDGMFISTGTNKSWVNNYPPFIVDDNGTIYVPEYTMGDAFTIGNTIPYLFTTTLSGFSKNAKVYVNILAAGSGNVTVQEAMNSYDKYYYTYEA